MGKPDRYRRICIARRNVGAAQRSLRCAAMALRLTGQTDDAEHASDLESAAHLLRADVTSLADALDALTGQQPPAKQETP